MERRAKRGDERFVAWRREQRGERRGEPGGRFEPARLGAGRRVVGACVEFAGNVEFADSGGSDRVDFERSGRVEFVGNAEFDRSVDFAEFARSGRVEFVGNVEFVDSVEFAEFAEFARSGRVEFADSVEFAEFARSGRVEFDDSVEFAEFARSGRVEFDRRDLADARFGVPDAANVLRNDAGRALRRFASIERRGVRDENVRDDVGSGRRESGRDVGSSRREFGRDVGSGRREFGRVPRIRYQGGGQPLDDRRKRARFQLALGRDQAAE